MNHPTPQAATPRTPLDIDGVVRWPADIAADYRAAGYWQDRSVQSFIAEAVDARPDAVAIVDGDRRWTYRHFWAAAGRCARAFAEHGLRPGDRVVLQLPNGIEFAVFTLACLRSGVIPVMALPAHRRSELTHLAQLSQARALVIAADDRGVDLRVIAQQIGAEVDSVEKVIVLGDLSTAPDTQAPGTTVSGTTVSGGTGTGTPEITLASLIGDDAPDAASSAPGDPALDDPTPDDPFDPAGQDIACLLLSGGTTGLPKLIVRTHDDYVYNILECARVSEFSATTVYLGALPCSHNFALACPGILGTWFVGGRVVFLPTPSAANALRTIDDEGVTLTAAVPAVAQSWIEYEREHQILTRQSLRVLQVGGSRMPDELAARVTPVLGARLQQVFGMAEGLINMTRLDDPDDIIETTQGRPVSVADEIAVVDELDQPVPDGEPGRLLTRGPYTPRGYFRAAEHNARSFTADGWYGSGDIVIRRPDGNLVVAGRDKDMINRGGEKISAEEVENFAYQLPGVEMAAAVAMPDAVLGERLCIYLVVAEEYSVQLADLAALMNRAGVAKFKIPERLVLVTDMPTTKVGKIDKKAMRADIARRLDADQTPVASAAAASPAR